MYSYIAYGLNILSASPLSDLVSVEKTEADVIIKQGKIEYPLPKTNCTKSYFYMNEEEAYLFWKEVGAFLVRKGKEIIVDPRPDVEERLIRLPLLGMVLAAVLQQRNVPALHGSAVSLNGDAIAFLGRKGMGKSTLAAALYARGHYFLADDLIALDLTSPVSPLAIPSFPQIKLMPDTATSVFGNHTEIFQHLASGIEKLGFSANDRFSQNHLPIKHIYVLSEGSVPEIEPIQPQDALLQIISQTYTARVFKEFLRGEKAASHFLQCVEITNKVPIYRLKRPRSLSALPDVVRLVEEHSTSNLNKLTR